MTSNATANPKPTDPGRTLGIIAIILALIFPLAGMPVASLSRARSYYAGYPETLGKVAFWLCIAILPIHVCIYFIAPFFALFLLYSVFELAFSVG